MILRATPLFLAGALCLFGFCAPIAAEARPASSIPSAALIAPAVLAARLKGATAPKPLVLQVGFRKLFDQAHIPDAEFAGPASEDSGLALLRARVEPLPRDAPIVIYCGCCPWSHCPNIAAAYDALRALGFTHVRVLHIRDNFGTNWVNAGYPVTKGVATDSSHGN
jgi:thiosulfate/3-mercaptopyruvate sulfurtransferase